MFEIAEFKIKPVVDWSEEESMVKWARDNLWGGMMAEREKLLEKAIGRVLGGNVNVSLESVLGSGKLEVVRMANGDTDKYFFDGLPIVEFYNSLSKVVVDDGIARLVHKYRMLV